MVALTRSPRRRGISPSVNRPRAGQPDGAAAARAGRRRLDYPIRHRRAVAQGGRHPTRGGATASVFLTPPNFIPAWPVTTHLCAGNGRNDPNASAVAYLHEKGIAAPRGCAPSLYACLFHDTEAALHSRRRTAPPECADPCAEILSPALDVAPDSSERASWAVRRPDS